MLYSVERAADQSILLRLRCDPGDARMELPLWIIEARGDYPVRPILLRSRVLKDIYSLCIFKRGRAVYRDKQRGQIRLEEGAAVFARPGFRHIYGSKAGDLFEDYVLFRGPLADQLARCGVLDSVGLFPAIGLTALEPIVRRSHDSDFAEQLKAGLDLARLLTDAADAENDRRTPELAHIVEYIRQNPQAHHRNGELAKRCGMSERWFRARFVEQTGMTPASYCERVRMNRACELLRGTGMSVGRIAAELGYDDPLYFSRRFSQLMSMPPSRYRTHEI